MRRGIVRTFQINQLFNAADAAAVARAHRLQPARHQRPHLAGAGPRRTRRAALRRRCSQQFHLDDVQDQGRTARLRQRRQLEIATALACNPRVLLLDEPVAGVPEGERQEIFDIVNALPPR